MNLRIDIDRLVLQVKVENEESDEAYNSSWSYMQHIQSNAVVGHDRRTFHKELTDKKVNMQLNTWDILTVLPDQAVGEWPDNFMYLSYSPTEF